MSSNPKVPAADGRRRSQVRTAGWASALLIPVSYIFGRFYLAGWTTAYGLPTAAFNASFEDALFAAYLGSIEAAASLFSALPKNGWVVFLAIVIAISLVFGLLLAWTKFFVFLVRIAESMRSHVAARIQKTEETRTRGGLKLLWRAYIIGTFPILVIAVAFYVFFLAVLPAIAGEKIGLRSGAEAKIAAQKALESGQFRERDRFVILRTPDDTSQWLLVNCNDLGCGAISRDRAAFFPWDRIDHISGN